VCGWINSQVEQRNGRIAILIVCALTAVTGCHRDDSGAKKPADTNNFRGTPIAVVRTNARELASVVGPHSVQTQQFEGEFLRVTFDQLSNFKYDTYEVYDEVSGGRPLTRSDDVIPAHIKALDGKRVVVKGFVMPLRLKKGLVTEFLLYRDQAACCFGAAAKMNHYMRVTMEGKGFQPGSQLTHKVYGTLRVGEIHVQGYLTGIYQMSAVSVEEEP
jgi:hypothetical protein